MRKNPCTFPPAWGLLTQTCLPVNTWWDRISTGLFSLGIKMWRGKWSDVWDQITSPRVTRSFLAIKLSGPPICPFPGKGGEYSERGERQVCTRLLCGWWLSWGRIHWLHQSVLTPRLQRGTWDKVGYLFGIWRSQAPTPCEWKRRGSFLGGVLWMLLKETDPKKPILQGALGHYCLGKVLTGFLGDTHCLKPPTLARHPSNHLPELFYDRRSW